MKKSDVVKKILAERFGQLPKSEAGEAFAPSNIALVKYWGKRDVELNLPITSSLSVSLGDLGTKTVISPAENQDFITLNGEELSADHKFSVRLSRFLDLFRPVEGFYFNVETVNTVPTAAGLASSASGFAATVKALDRFFGWDLSESELSILARMGSGSACRSIFDGFVKWNGGEREDGMDSYAEKLSFEWPELCIGVVEVSSAEKSIGSTEGMKRTVESAPLYQSWPKQVQQDLVKLEQALTEKNIVLLGETSEQNALSMHATMIASWPPVIYWQPESIEVIKLVHQARATGLPLYLTMDAGPNVKLIFEKEHVAAVKELFPQVKVVSRG